MTLCEMLKKLQIDRIDGYIIDIGGCNRPIRESIKECIIHFDMRQYLLLDNDIEKGKVNYPWYEKDGFFDLNKSDWTENVADWVFCLNTFEYVWNPFKAVSSIYSMLKPKGTAVISFPFIYPHHNLSDYDCSRYTRTGVNTLLKESGFKNISILGIETKSPKELANFYNSQGFHKAESVNHNEINFIAKGVK